MPLFEKARVEIYLPDLPKPAYQDLQEAFEREFTYTFGGCTVVRGLSGSYLSHLGLIIEDRVNLIYTDTPFAFQVSRDRLSLYMDKLRIASEEALQEEAVLVAVMQVFHSGE